MVSTRMAWHLVGQYLQNQDRANHFSAIEAVRALEERLNDDLTVPEAVFLYVRQATGSDFLFLSEDGKQLYYRDPKAVGPDIVFTVHDVVLALYDIIIAYLLPMTPQRFLLFLIRREHQRVSKEIRDLVEDRLGKWEFD